jgi:hypothetical protein
MVYGYFKINIEIAEIFNLQEKKSAKIKCPLFSQKPQKFHTAEINGYTVLLYENVSNALTYLVLWKVFKGYIF